MEELREPQPGDIYILSRFYVSENHTLEREDTILRFKCFKSGWVTTSEGLSTMNAERKNARWVIFEYEHSAQQGALWVDIDAYPVWINPNMSNEPGTVHYKVISYIS